MNSRMQALKFGRISLQLPAHGIEAGTLVMDFQDLKRCVKMLMNHAKSTKDRIYCIFLMVDFERGVFCLEQKQLFLCCTLIFR